MSAIGRLSIAEPDETEINAGNWTTAALRQMTGSSLLHLGTRRVVYLKADVCDREILFVLYGADGAPLATAEAVETVAEIAAERGLRFVPVH